MRTRLALLVAATTSLVLVAFLVPLALLVRTVATDRAMADASTTARALGPLVAVGDRRTLALTVAQANDSGETPTTVFLPDGATIGAPAPRDDAVELAAHGRSITAQTAGGREILVAVQGRPGGTAVVRTFVPTARLHHGVARAWTVLALLGLVLLAAGVAVADRLARSLVRPIGEVAKVSHRVARGDLDARVVPSGPREIRDVGTALNHLATRVHELLAHERAAVADLSHRLRTPLTALRLETGTLRDPDEAGRVGAAVDAVERMADTVIREAARSGRETPASCDAARVVAERVAFWAALAEDQERTVETALADGPLPVAVAADDLGACVDALLENVFAHTAEGVGLSVELAGSSAGGARLVVADVGVGFSHPDVPNRGVGGGTGLGLDIARRTAETSGGRLRLGRSRSGGAEVVIELGPADLEG